MSERTHDKAMLAGVVLCGVSVAAYSSWAQFNIADAVGYPTGLAWVVPVATDATAALGTRAWMSPHYGDGVRSYGRFLAIMAIVLSILTAALHLVIPTDSPIPCTGTPVPCTGSPVPWYLRLAIGGLPSLALAALVHLGALTAQDRPKPSKTRSPSRRAASPHAVAAVNQVSPAEDLVTVGQVATTDNAMNLSTTEGLPQIDRTTGSRRKRMFAYLDEHPDATGAELDSAFSTTNYGRRVRRDWEAHRRGLHLVEQASGE
jgi:hypothetical protein